MAYNSGDEYSPYGRRRNVQQEAVDESLRRESQGYYGGLDIQPSGTQERPTEFDLHSGGRNSLQNYVAPGEVERVDKGGGGGSAVSGIATMPGGGGYSGGFGGEGVSTPSSTGRVRRGQQPPAFNREDFAEPTTSATGGTSVVPSQGGIGEDRRRREFAQDYLNSGGDSGVPPETAQPPTAPDQQLTGSALDLYGTGNIPGAESLAWGDVGRLRGANTAEWGEGGTPGYEDASIKNTFLKIASRYDPRSPGAAQQVVNDPDFKKFFPMATVVSHPKGDMIDFGDGKPVDVLLNAVEGGSGEAWQWLDSSAQGMGGGGGGGMGVASSGGGSTSPLSVESTLGPGGINTQQGALERYLAMLNANQLFNPAENFMLRRGL